MAKPVPLLDPLMALPVNRKPRVVEAPLPWSSVKSEAGVLVPMPSLLLVASQKKAALFCESKPLAPINGTEPAVSDENNGADEKVLAPAMVCAPVVTRPLAVAEASGILKVCVVTEEAILKSVPLVPVAKVCVLPVKPFKLPIEVPLAEITPVALL